MAFNDVVVFSLLYIDKNRYDDYARVDCNKLISIDMRW